MSNPTVYVETTVIGHAAARLQSDIVVAARQYASIRWWESKDRYSLFVSQLDQLAQELIRRHGVPETEPRDASHIAIAAVSGVQYLLTWNFRHIGNPSTRKLIEDICQSNGYALPVICSPDELLEI
jgi:hypothetical protein